jgi:hypothetical protein
LGYIYFFSPLAGKFGTCKAFEMPGSIERRFRAKNGVLNGISGQNRAPNGISGQKGVLNGIAMAGSYI